MRKFLAIWRRELAACFLSPLAYVVFVVFVFAHGIQFYFTVLRQEETDVQLSSILYASMTFFLPIVVTVISMRLFAEEKKSGTIETLMTAPVTEAQVIMGKYAGALSFLLIVIVPSSLVILPLVIMSPGISFSDLDTGSLITGGVIIVLVSCFWMSIGLLISLTTRNQIIAAISTLCVIILGMLGGVFIANPGGHEELSRLLSTLYHIEEFSRGVFSTQPVVLYLSLTIMLIITSIRVLELRRL